MKKAFFTLALALGLGLAASAQEGGLFGYGPQRGGGENYSTDYNDRTGGLLNLPGSHGLDEDQSPLGTGTVLLLGLGAAYLATKKRKNQKNPKHHNSKFFLIAAVITAGMISAQPNVAVGQTRANTTETLVISDYATANSWVSGTAYTSASTTNISFTGAGSGNNCKYYSTGNGTWRFYSSGNGKITIESPTGSVLKKITLTTDGTNYFSTAPSGWSYSNKVFTANQNTSTNTVTIANGNGTTKIEKIGVEYTPATPSISISPATIAAEYTGSYNDGYSSGALTLTPTNISGTNPNVFSVVYSNTENGSYTSTVPAMMGGEGWGASIVYQTNTFKVGWYVDENETQSTRECYFKVKYGTDTYSNAVHVSQGAAPAPTYTVTLTGGNAISANYAGTVTSSAISVSTTVPGTVTYAMAYYDNGTYSTTTNPYEDWFEASLDANNNIECTLLDNSTGTERTAQFKVYATNATDEAYSEVITLTQDYVYAPTFTPNGATFHGTQDVTLASATPGASFRYTLDGTNPTATTGIAYDGTPISLNTTKTVKAIAYVGVSGSNVTSAVSEATFTLEKAATPTFVPNGSVFTDTQEVTINCGTTGATIYYTINNGEITEYTAPFTVSATSTVEAFASASGYADSETASATFTKATVMTVAEANSYIQGGGDATVEKYVSGIIESVVSYNSTYNSITYYISDDGTSTGRLYVYGGLSGIDGWTFSSKDDLKAGDIVIVKGKLKNYSGTYEIDVNNELVSWLRLPSITAENVNLATNATSGEISYTLNNPVAGGSLSISQTGDWFTATLVEAQNKVTLSTTANTGDERTGKVTITYTYNTNETVSKEVSVKQAAYEAPSTWVLTNFADLTPADVFVIVGTADNTNYALKNSDASSSAPAAVSVGVTTVEDVTILENAPATNLQWNISGNATDGFVFYPVGETTTWLYCNTSSSNNRLRIGSTTNNHFTMASSGYLQYSDYYIGVYTGGPDWRGYTSTTGNIANQTFSFFRKVTDPVTVTKTITPYTTQADGWYLIASPVASVTPSAGNGFLTNTYDLYRFNQSADKVWENYKAHTADFIIKSGTGYLYANSGVNNENVTLSFTGQPYNGNGVVGLVYDSQVTDETIKGLNLVGNPFKTAATINKAFYRINDTHTGISAEVASGSSVEALEGVFVYATATDKQVIFTRISEGSATPTNNSPMVTMNLTQNRGGVIDRAIVRFNGNDNLPKFQLFENSTKLYIAQDGKDYAIVGSEAQGEMPVCFQAKADGQYTISVDAENVEMGYLHLIDNITGADVDLLANPSYTFNAKWDDYTSRFRLVFSANNSNNAEAESDNFAFISNGQIILNGVNNNATLQVIDMMGRIVSSEQINGNSANLAPTASGVYVLRLINGTETKTQKIVVK